MNRGIDDIEVESSEANSGCSMASYGNGSLAVQTDLNETFEMLKRKLLQDEETFRPAIEEFVKSFKDIKTDAHIICH